eukprot:GHVR01107072.1.p1 GENE.GHVR01107072.1~~GHVR01107072.1.p1  ORF type:complete len:116 (+),score=5.38 GHVR01107072.1:130-477(+)
MPIIVYIVVIADLVMEIEANSNSNINSRINSRINSSINSNINSKANSQQTNNCKKYSGIFISGSPDGTAKITFTNGAKYMGNISKGIIEGEGTYIHADKRIINGYWEKNRLINII